MTDGDGAKATAGSKAWRRAVRLCPFVWVARARGKAKLALLLAECVAAGALGVWLWSVTLMARTPDVGDPFPEKPGSAPYVATSAESTNAYALYLAAYARHRTYTAPPPAAARSLTGRNRLGLAAAGGRPMAQTARGPEEVGRVRRWLDENAEALALFHAAAACDAATPMAPTAAVSRTSWVQMAAARMQALAWLAVEDAALAEADGRLDDAWRDYHAVLRAARHVAQFSGPFERQTAAALRQHVARRLNAWCGHPANTPARVRRALADVQALDAMPPPDDVYTLRVAYAQASAALRGWSARRRQGLEDPFTAGLPVFGPVLGAVESVRWSAGREPERTRRVIDLAFANWRAWAALPPDRRPKPAAVARLSAGPTAGMRVEFFAFPPGPETPPAARVLPPDQLAARFVSTRESTLMVAWTWTQFRAEQRAERRDRAALILTLAEALYRREHDGDSPPDNEALVGPYLTALPDDGSADLDDGTTPLVESPWFWP